MQSRYVRSLSSALAICVTVFSACAQSSWHVKNTLHIGGEGNWDYLTVDSTNHRLFVPRTTHTMVIDANSGKVVGDIPGQKKAHGVALVPNLNRGFVTDGAGSIIIFDLKTYAVLGTLASLPDSDGIIYDAQLNEVLVVSGDGNALMTIPPNIDPRNGKIAAPIMLGGAPEFLASDGHGKVYVNLEDKDLVAVVDLKTRQVTARWPVAPGGSPVGMSMDSIKHRLFIGCRKPQKLIVMSTRDGKVESSLPIGAVVDATAFDAGQAFASCFDGSLVVAGEKDGKLEVAQVVKTPRGARTMGLDPTTHQTYLPTAELVESGGARPTPKPGTFMIVVVGHE